MPRSQTPSPKKISKMSDSVIDLSKDTKIKGKEVVKMGHVLKTLRTHKNAIEELNELLAFFKEKGKKKVTERMTALFELAKSVDLKAIEGDMKILLKNNTKMIERMEDLETLLSESEITNIVSVFKQFVDESKAYIERFASIDETHQCIQRKLQIIPQAERMFGRLVDEVLGLQEELKSVKREKFQTEQELYAMSERMFRMEQRMEELSNSKDILRLRSEEEIPCPSGYGPIRRQKSTVTSVTKDDVIKILKPILEKEQVMKLGEFNTIIGAIYKEKGSPLRQGRMVAAFNDLFGKECCFSKKTGNKSSQVTFSKEILKEYFGIEVLEVESSEGCAFTSCI